MEQMSEVGSSFINSYINPYIQKLEDINKAAVNNLNQIGRTVSSITTHLDSETERVTNTLKNSISVITQQLIKDMEEYKLKAEIRDQEILGKYAYYLLGVLKYPQEIKKVPLPIIAQLIDRINLYTQVSFPDVTAIPSEKVYQGYTGFNMITRYKLSSMTLFLKEEFEKKALEAVSSESKPS